MLFLSIIQIIVFNDLKIARSIENIKYSMKGHTAS